jgi:hypothetical protein
MDSPPQAGRSKVANSVLYIVGAIVILFYGLHTYGRGAGLPSLAAPASANGSNLVEYTITVFDCTDFGVTYAMPNGTSQKDVRVCNGTQVVDTFYGSSGQSLYLSAQNIGPDHNGQIFTCAIDVDHQRVAQVQSQGFAKIASCNAALP